MTYTAVKIEPEKVVKKKVYLSKNKKILLELIKQDKKDKEVNGSN